MVCFYLHDAGHFTHPYNMHAAPSQHMGFSFEAHHILFNLRTYAACTAQLPKAPSHPDSPFDRSVNCIAAVHVGGVALMEGQLGHCFGEMQKRMLNLAAFWLATRLQRSSSAVLSCFHSAADTPPPAVLAHLLLFFPPVSFH